MSVAIDNGDLSQPNLACLWDPTGAAMAAGWGLFRRRVPSSTDMRKLNSVKASNQVSRYGLMLSARVPSAWMRTFHGVVPTTTYLPVFFDFRCLRYVIRGSWVRLYSLMQRLNWPKTYVGRIFLLCFIGTHIPLIALIGYAAFRPTGTPGDVYWTLGVALLATLIAAGFTFYAVAAMLKPVLRVTTALDQYVFAGVHPDLPVEYGDEAGRLMASVQSTVVKLGAAIEELTFISITDPLTGARNRRWLNDTGIPEFQRCREGPRTYSLLSVDIDNFKAINDAHGHSAGDQVLMSVSDAIRRSIRSGNHVVRTGGDEFCVLLPDTDAQAARAIAERIRGALATKSGMLASEHQVTLSVGGATAEGGKLSFAELYRQADRNLYRAKNDGRNRSVTA